MSGHSKWATIRRKKGAIDAKRGKIFTKLIREISTAARLGGPNVDGNPRLRLVVDKARAANMPKDTIKRAIDRASGAAEGDAFEELVYEGYGPGGVAMLVEALTDNRNRTASNVRAAFTKSGGAMGETGSVGFMFDRIGEIVYGLEAGDDEKVLEAAIEAGAQDVQSDANGHVITCEFDDIGDVSAALEEALGSAESVNTVWRPQTTTEVDEEKAESVLRLISVLEDDDDVQNVYSNFEVSDEVLDKLSA
jgi:YebC/PmpR family DNA-binding regulatory protein